MNSNSTKTNPDEAVDRHVVYGYIERQPRKGKPPRWYVGVTNQQERRHKQHIRTETKPNKGYFYNWIQKQYRKQPKRKHEDVFNEILEYKILQVIVGTSREAEYFESKWTEQKNALRPNGFNLRQGGYRGRLSEESKTRLSAALNQPL